MDWERRTNDEIYMMHEMREDIKTKNPAYKECFKLTLFPFPFSFVICLHYCGFLLVEDIALACSHSQRKLHFKSSLLFFTSPSLKAIYESLCVRDRLFPFHFAVIFLDYFSTTKTRLLVSDIERAKFFRLSYVNLHDRIM